MNNTTDAVVGSTRPYLIRAIYDWAVEESLTPQIMVNVDFPQVRVPKNYAKDGKIVLNLHPSSIRDLEIGKEFLLFSARFGGRAEDLVIPLEAVMAVYSRENGQGIVFQADGSGVTPPPQTGNNSDQKSNLKKPPGVSKPGKAGSHLKVVK